MSKHTSEQWKAWQRPEEQRTNYWRNRTTPDEHDGDTLRGYCGEANARLIAAIAGVSPWATPLSVYLDKIGEDPEQEETEARRCGASPAAAIRASIRGVGWTRSCEPTQAWTLGGCRWADVATTDEC